MSIRTAALMPGVTLAPGGRWPAKSVYSRHQFPDLPYSVMPNGELHFFPGDCRRIRIPETSQAWRLDDNEPGAEVSPPTTSWERSTVVFRAGLQIPVPGGTYTTLNLVDARKHPDIAVVETAHGVRLTVGGVITNVSWQSISVFVDREVAPPTPSPRIDESATEPTPLPRRAPAKKA